MRRSVSYNRIRGILLAEWDPIGISDEWAAHDEYDIHAQHLHSLLAKGASAGELETYLIRSETELMGLPPAPERARRVAEMLVHPSG